jgi:hypothetical protein
MRRAWTALIALGLLVALWGLRSAHGGAQGGGRRLHGVGPTDAEVLGWLASGLPQRFKPVGSTSVVLKMSLDAPVDAAFRPRTARHPYGWLAEITAYRLAVVLGLDGVPPVVSRTLRRDQIRRLIDADSVARWRELEGDVLWEGNAVRGAAVLWVRGLTPLGLESDRRARDWRTWLSVEGTIAPDRRALARDLSNMLVFDYLIGNFDRFSGANLSGTPDGARLFIRDHNLALRTPVPREQLARTRARWRPVERYSAALVSALHRLDRARLRDAIFVDAGTRQEPERVEAQVADILGRRDDVLSRVATLVDAHGAERVLVFH